MRIATFNIENLDETPAGKSPSLETRIQTLRPQLNRINADVLCLQEVHGQEREGQPRDLLALRELIKTTQYEHFHIATTKTTAGEVYDVRNLVVLSRYPILQSEQFRNDKMEKLAYRKVTAKPREDEAKDVEWERPILYCQLDTDKGPLHLINVHFKSRLPSTIPGQKINFAYKTVPGWAEGYFLSSVKRVGQALEARILIDEIFDQDANAKIVICGDFNAEPGQVPVEAVQGRVENTGNEDLVGRELMAASESVPKDLRFTHIHQGHRNLLDHMLFSKSLLSGYKGAEIHNEQIHDESIAFAMDNKYPESDHAPFLADF